MGVVPNNGERLGALARALKNADEKVLLRELRKGVRTPLLALLPKIEESARQKIPRRGGFQAQFIPSLRLKVQQRNTGRYPGVRLVANYPGRISRIDRGFLRHPIFPDTATKTRDEWDWMSQKIPAGFFTDPIKADLAEVRASVEDALDRVARQIEIDMTKGSR